MNRINARGDARAEEPGSGRTVVLGRALDAGSGAPAGEEWKWQGEAGVARQTVDRRIIDPGIDGSSQPRARPGAPFATPRIAGFLAGLDALALAAAAGLAHVWAGAWAGRPGLELGAAALSVPMAFAFVVITVTSLAAAGAYEPGGWRGLRRDAIRAIAILSAVLMVAQLISVLGPALALGSPGGGVLLWATALPLLVGVRAAAWQALSTLQTRDEGQKPIIVVGQAEAAAAIIERLQNDGSPRRLAGVLHMGGSGNGHTDFNHLNGVPVLGTVASLPEAMAGAARCDVLIAGPQREYAAVDDIITNHMPEGATASLSLYSFAAVEGEASNDLPWFQDPSGIPSWRHVLVKRPFDILVSGLMLAAAAPLMAVIALAVKLDSPGGVLFRQLRVGRNGRLFHMYKFRSMRQDAEADLQKLDGLNEANGPMFKIRDDPRITRVGRIIRRLSLDELPQLFNVMQGTMSLVGPRPPLPSEVDEYEPWHLRRLATTPGITGLWQVSRNGRDISFDEMVRLDIRYIENWSPWLDVVIMLKTVPVVLGAKGAY